MKDTGIDVITGAFSYTGKHTTKLLLDSGRTVRTITGHPEREHPFGDRVDATPYRFDDFEALKSSLAGATTLYNTYWVRFTHGTTSFDAAINNSRTLFEAAREAGVERIVHVSIANPDRESPLPYYRGKGLVEQALADCGVEYSVVRPTVLFGHEDVLINNIAWLMRKLHAFAIPGDGEYLLQPVHVEDVARCCIEAAAAPSGTIINAAGPETMSFNELVQMVRVATGARALVAHAPRRVALLGSKLVGLFVGDVVLTWEEVDGLCAGLLACEGPVNGRISFRDWLANNRQLVGRRYANELERHFRSAPAARPLAAEGR